MRGAAVVVMGAGGNIGSQLVPHLARMGGVARLVLVDRDGYEARNRQNQDGVVVGSGKAGIQAARARRCHPGLRVTARRADIETMPIGMLRCDLLVSTLDSRRARRAANRIARGLGLPWLDAGVKADGTLARVTRYAADPNAPCLECGWAARDYSVLEQRYRCDGRLRQAAATAAGSELGALAASLLAIECRQVLEHRDTALPAGSSLVIDAAHRRHYVTLFRRNPSCGADHRPWSIVRYRGLGRPLHSLFAWGGRALGAEPELRIPGHMLAARTRCVRCARVREAWSLPERWAAQPRCGRCGGPTVSGGFDLTEGLSRSELPAAVLRRPLRSIGLRTHDIVRLGAGSRAIHAELVP